MSVELLVIAALTAVWAWLGANSEAPRRAPRPSVGVGASEPASGTDHDDDDPREVGARP